MQEAELIILVSCSVRQLPEDRVFGILQNISKWQKKRNILCGITGCMIRKTSLRGEKFKNLDQVLKISRIPDFTFRIEDTSKIPKILDILPTLKNTKKLEKEVREIEEKKIESFLIKNSFCQMISRKNSDCVKFEKIRQKNLKNFFQISPCYQNNFSVFIPISTGCNHFCSYCIVPFARGKEICRSPQEILAEISAAVLSGAKEITLLGQNVNRYFSAGVDFPDLLKKIENISGDFWIRFLSPHPAHFCQKTVEVCANSKKIAKHFHIPVQSGDNKILEKMNRGYQVEDFQKLLQKIRKKIPNISISTDIIVGFPGETEKQFENSVELCKTENFCKIFIAKFSPRIGTAAANFPDQISQQEKKSRFEKINNILKISSQKNNKKFVGKICRFLVEKKESKIFSGRNSANKNVFFTDTKNSKNLLGKFVSVKITSAENFFLRGEFLSTI